MDEESVGQINDRSAVHDSADVRDVATHRARRRTLPRPLPKQAHTWVPHLDVFETPTGVTVLVDLPGVHDNDVEIWLDGDDLIIDGQRHMAAGAADDTYCRREREHGKFYRRLPLPLRTTAEQAVAHFDDGVLEVELPRSTGQRRRPHRIAISPSREEELAEREREQAALLNDEAWTPALD